MADEQMRIQAPGSNGNGLQVDWTQKKFGLTGPNVALLLLILLIGGIAYLRTGTVDKTMQAGQAQLAGMEDRIQKRMDALLGRIDTLMADLHAQTLVLTTNNAKVTAGQQELQAHIDQALERQTALVHTQTEAIAALVHKQTEYIEAWFSEIGARLEWLDHNVANPDRRLPLRAPSSHEERQKERSR